uniref:Anthranilate synthase alpha subunit 2, chloroplastic-like isoform X1 n=1 Tax=Tanacetum cinerariifolium TaxID=118510 RepID=A0A6L2KLE4_TANCI|nr:anthranilate synthase alpha subunit 2, chloroplastic-like isoform X1 [Tanacetum cinerariifolium]
MVEMDGDMAMNDDNGVGGGRFVIADELDYLITKDRVVLHDLFMLTMLPFSKIILIGIANVIDLANRFLPKLQSLNLNVLFYQPLPYTVFQPQALELCVRIVLCSAVKIFRKGKKDTTIGELNKYYIDLCKSTSIPPIGIMELSCMCRVLGDQYCRALRIVNPSPYMTYLQARGSILVASSLKILTCLKKRKVINRPLVGTIRRAKTPKEDYMLENQLLHNEKQCVEHIMLVDLGRNDVGKVKAMELIDKLEVTRRRPCSSGFEGISFTRDMDIALALRTIVFPTALRYDTMYSYRNSNKRRDWVAHLQARAGIVADSDPGDEQRECENKAATLACAIDLAESSFVDK